MFKKIKRFFRNLKDWFPILISDEQWDYGFAEEALLHKLKLMEDFFVSGKTHIAEEEIYLILESLNPTINALERLVEGDYIHIPEGLEPELKFVEDKEDPQFYIIETEYHPDFGEEKVQKAFQDAKDKENKDRDLVYHNLRYKAHMWWD